MSAIFVTGTGTDCGKTYVACRVIQRLRSAGVSVGAYKPVCSGVVGGRWGDADRLAAASGQEPEIVCPQRFKAAVAPPDAAAAEGRAIDETLTETAFQSAVAGCDRLVVEGAGGFLSPFTASQLVGDWAAERALPLVAVVDVRLGAISDALLLAEAAERRLLPAAFVLNEGRRCEPDVRDSTVTTLAKELGDRIVARIPEAGQLLAFDSASPDDTADEPLPDAAIAALFHDEESDEEDATATV